MAYQCVSASNQYFTIAAPNITVPPVTFGMWVNVSSVVAKDTALFIWRGSINTGLFLKYVNPNWELRYYVAGGSQWQTATGLYLGTGVWQHACVAISSSQARVYLNGVSFTNNVSHSSANINAVGDVARDPLADGNHTSFNGLVAEPAIWTVSLSDAECLALAKRVSPLRLTNRLANLVLYKDMIRDLNRGSGPTLTAVNSPTVVAHPPMIYPSSRQRSMLRSPHFLAPFRMSMATTHGNPVMQGLAEIAGAEQGLTQPIGEVSS
jgi:hypothetical protein